MILLLFYLTLTVTEYARNLIEILVPLTDSMAFPFPTQGNPEY